MKIMMDCDKLIEKKTWGELSTRGKEWSEREKGQEGKKERGVKKVHSLRVTSPTHTRTTAGLEGGHLPLQARPLNWYFQQREALKAEWRSMNMWSRSSKNELLTAGQMTIASTADLEFTLLVL